VAPDGKSRTLTTEGTDSKGKKFRSVAVYGQAVAAPAAKEDSRSSGRVPHPCAVSAKVGTRQSYKQANQSLHSAYAIYLHDSLTILDVGDRQ